MVSVAQCFGLNLVRARKAAGLTQDEAGFRASVHRTEVSQLERGRRIPRIDTLVKLAAAVSVNPEALLKGIAWEPGEVRTGHFGQPERD